MLRRAAVFLVALAIALPLQAASAGRAAAAQPPFSTHEREEMLVWARDTWAGFMAMTDKRTGLPSDNLAADGTVARYTSPTNIATWLWAVLAARELGFINADKASGLVARTLATVRRLERSHGQFYNWYDPHSGKRLTTWPDSGDRVYGFLSSVDNGWLAAALMMVANGLDGQAQQARRILANMDFGFYYDPSAGLLRGGAWTEEPPGCSVPTQRDGQPTWFTCHHYGSLNTEPRIASYIAIARGQLPATHYFKMWRTFPATCDWSWQEMQPEGVTRTYLGIDVFEGTYEYRGKRLVPAWGGSMFEALMVPLLVPEEDWAPDSWGINHPLYVESQIEHGLDEAAYGYWGFSPASDPAGGYREYGVDPIGMEPNGYASDEERTYVDYGFDACPGREETSIPTDYGHGVVTPHAIFLALEFDPDAAFANLYELRDDFDVYGEFGWYDAVNVVSGDVAKRYLALDQGMIIVALANALESDALQRYFTAGDVKNAIEPLIAMERFESGPAE